MKHVFKRGIHILVMVANTRAVITWIAYSWLDPLKQRCVLFRDHWKHTTGKSPG